MDARDNNDRHDAEGGIIALSGAHGTGKTTAAYALAAELKKGAAREVGIILEVARRCPYPIFAVGQTPTRAAQMWIFTEQIRAELDAVRIYGTVVSDRTIVDCIAYTSVAGFHDLAFAQLALARHHVHIYRRVIFHGTAGNPWCCDDGLRSRDMAMRAEMELRLLELYAQLGVRVERTG